MPSSTTCKHPECSRPAGGGKGYCRRHYEAWKHGGLPKARYKTCRVEGCRKPLAARGRCEEHFVRDHPGKHGAAATESSA